MATTILSRAIQLAVQAHAGQFRAGTSVPYVVHPLECASLLAALGASEAVQAAAVLHDVVEDTPVTLAVVEALCGASVAALVAEVTDPAELTGAEAKARQMRLASEGGYSPNALLIKIADCISNARDLTRRPVAWEEAKLRRYTRFLGSFVGVARVQSVVAERLACEFNVCY